MVRVILIGLVLVGNVLAARVGQEIVLMQALRARASRPAPVQRLSLPRGYDAYHQFITLTPGERGTLLASVRGDTLETELRQWAQLQPALRLRGVALVAYCVGPDCIRYLRQTTARLTFPVLMGAQPNAFRTLTALDPASAALIDPAGRVVKHVAAPPKTGQNSEEVKQWLNGL